MTPPLNTIVRGDCIKVLATLPSHSVNFGLTDPPYLVGYKPRDGRRIAGDMQAAWLWPAFAHIYRVLERDAYCFTFYGWPHADRFMQAFRAAGFRPVGHFSFVKPHTSSTGHVRCQHEVAYLLAKGNPARPTHPLGDVIAADYTGNRLHPTQKAVAALLPVVETYSRKGGTVLDPFAGSGSSLLAAAMLGRNYVGIELDAGYHAAAVRRLKEHHMGRAA
jgi:site-specific DNA-methyltransferase (adenine-specific)